MIKINTINGGGRAGCLTETIAPEYSQSVCSDFLNNLSGSIAMINGWIRDKVLILMNYHDIIIQNHFHQ